MGLSCGDTAGRVCRQVWEWRPEGLLGGQTSRTRALSGAKSSGKAMMGLNQRTVQISSNPDEATRYSVTLVKSQSLILPRLVSNHMLSHSVNIYFFIVRLPGVGPCVTQWDAVGNKRSPHMPAYTREGDIKQGERTRVTSGQDGQRRPLKRGQWS